MRSAMTRTLVALNAVSACAHLAQFGILYPLMALWLDAHGMQAWQVGLVGSSVWLGMLFGNLFAPGALQRWGASALAGAGCLGTAVVAVAMPHMSANWLVLWAAAAGLLGVCVGLRWIGVESWLYAIVDGAQRGRIVGLHETVIYAAQGVGPSLVALIGVECPLSFYAGALAAVGGAFSLRLARIAMPVSSDAPTLAPQAVLRGLWLQVQHALGVQLGLLAGLIDGVLFGMLGIYFVRAGMTPNQAAFMMTIFGLGGLLSQIPLGWWSDRYGVRSATQLIAVAGLLGCALLLSGNASMAWFAAFFLGCIAACGLTVAIIATTHEAAERGTEMGLAVAEVSIAFTLGSCIGPVLAGALMDSWGLTSLPLLTAVASAGLIAAARRNAQPSRDATDSTPVA